MKKKLVTFSIVLIAACLVLLAYDQIVPATAVHAACSQSPLASTVVSSDHQARIAQPVVVVGAGLVSVLLGILAISPLLVGDPERPGKGV